MARPLEWIERYSVPSHNHDGWAIIHIDSAGFLGVVSDYGNYAYHWSSFGDDFKKFLCGLDWHYLYGKLMHGRDSRIYDGRATLRSVQQRILELRRTRKLSFDRAREEWDLALDSEIDHDRSDGYSLWSRDTELEYPYELYETMDEPQCSAFCQKVWPRFIEALKESRHVPILPKE